MEPWGELLFRGVRELGVYPLRGPSVLLGSSEYADVPLLHQSTSPEHCTLVWDSAQKRAFAIDLSENGTYVKSNGITSRLTSLAEYELMDKDIIIVVQASTVGGDIWFEFRLFSNQPDFSRSSLGKGIADDLQSLPNKRMLHDFDALIAKGKKQLKVDKDEASTSAPIGSYSDKMALAFAICNAKDKPSPSSPSSTPMASATSPTVTGSYSNAIASPFTGIGAKDKPSSSLTSSTPMASATPPAATGSYSNAMASPFTGIGAKDKPSSSLTSSTRMASATPSAATANYWHAMASPFAGIGAKDKSSSSLTSSTTRASATPPAATGNYSNAMASPFAGTTAKDKPSSSLTSSTPKGSATPPAAIGNYSNAMASPFVGTNAKDKPSASMTSSTSPTAIDNYSNIGVIPDIVSSSVAKSNQTPPVMTSISMASAPSSSSATQLSAADRARKLLSSALPPDFFQPKTPETSVADGDCRSNPKSNALDMPSTSAASKPSTSAAATSDSSFVENNLICIICHEIFYRPMNISPCNHVFCGGCLALWLKKSRECPQCRQIVQNCGDHHMIKRMAEGFLETHPDRKRSAEELAQLDQQREEFNREKDRLLRTGSKGRGRYGGLASTRAALPALGVNISVGFGGGVFGPMHPGSHQNLHQPPFPPLLPNTGSSTQPHRLPGPTPAPPRMTSPRHPRPPAPLNICRQCPGAPPPTFAAHMPAVPPNNSSGGYIPPPASVQPYICRSASAHIACTCCHERLPARNGHPGVPPMQCSLCQALFCHLYWGCKGESCFGCLGIVTAFTTSVSELIKGLTNLTNEVEGGYFAAYLNQNNVMAMNILRSGYQLIQLNMIPELISLNLNSPVCRNCFLHQVVPSVAYAYRAQLTNSDLPGFVAMRHNCKFGKTCQMQKTSIQHAQEFNHICPPH